VQPRQRVRDAVLRQVVADGHLAAEAVPPIGDGHRADPVGEGVDQDRHAKVGQPQRVGDGPLVAEVGERDKHAVDVVAAAPEERRAALGIGPGFHGPELRVFGAERDDAQALGLQHVQHRPAAALAEMSGEEPSVANYEPQRGRGHCPPPSPVRGVLDSAIGASTGWARCRRTLPDVFGSLLARPRMWF
jgi:hypothetical protein